MIAIVLGVGPEVEEFLSRPPETRLQPALIYGANVTLHTRRYQGKKLPRINAFDPHGAGRLFKELGVIEMVALGSMRLTNPRITNWKSTPFVVRFFGYIRRNQDPSDPLRIQLGTELSHYVELPPLETVFPWLFVTSEVSVNPDADALAWALSNPASHGHDALLKMNGKVIHVFRVPRGAPHILNRRLFPSKLEDIHRAGATHIFFQRDRTVVLDIDYMVKYCSDRGITLQSFMD